MTATDLLEHTDHRPYPLPDRPWALSMHWYDLLFMHWPVPPDALRDFIPDALSVDTFEGEAWLGVVPFQMSQVRPRGLPSVPWLSRFPELNLRTYVKDADGKAGVWFFSLDAHNPVAVRLARWSFSLPYFDADMVCEADGDAVRYRSRRTHRGVPGARFEGTYQPTGAVLEHNEEIEHFLTERYCLYSANRRGDVFRGDIHHQPWPLQPAEIDLTTNAMTEQIGVTLPDDEPLLHFSRKLEVVAWLPEKIT
ncbi:MAG: DUF2071 domain-containing protein [Trueperaceae bacterium]|nr:DUF2071 domain-containing protein [Trueperaceae bacterium]